MKTFIKVTTQKIETIVCDSCGLQASAESDYEFHEFISIKHHCGYSSIHGDGKDISIDLCQRCFADMCGDSLRVVDKNKTEDFDDGCKMEQLEYNNIFDVITKSKTEASQLKTNCDIRLAARDILAKNIVSNHHELSVALKRVEQLWDAQYQSAEGNELHHLADLICAYEKKDWTSFFDEAQLENDDFMPGRLNFKSKFTFNEKQADSDTLKRVFTNKNIDEAKQYLFETIESVQLKYPELRLGQLLINAMNLQEPCPELFHVEDKVLAEKLNELSNSVSS